MVMGVGLFGKGFGGVGWGVICERGGKEIVGVWGGVFKVFGNVGWIVSGVVIG